MMHVYFLLCIPSVTTSLPVHSKCGPYGCNQAQREQGVHNNDNSIYRNKIDSKFDGSNIAFPAATRGLITASKALTAIGSVSDGLNINEQRAVTDTLHLLWNGIESRFVGFDPEKLTAALSAAESSRSQNSGQSLSMESGQDSRLRFSWENPISAIDSAAATGFKADTITGTTHNKRQTHVEDASRLARNVDINNIFNADFGLNGNSPVSVISSDNIPHLINFPSRRLVSDEAIVQSSDIQQGGIGGLIAGNTYQKKINISETNPNPDATRKAMHFSIASHNSGLLAGLFTDVNNQNVPIVNQNIPADAPEFLGRTIHGGSPEVIGSPLMPSRKIY